MSPVFRPIFESRHLAQGSLCPEVKQGIMRLYSMKYCPYAQRTRLILAVKKIPNEVININLKSKPDWYLERNPLGKVPCLEFDGKLVYESLITADYLDEVYQDSGLMNSEDPFQKSQDRIMIELFNKVTSSFYKVLHQRESDVEESWKQLVDGLQIFEKEIGKRDSAFFAGKKPGMLDYMIWPWMERLPAFPIFTKGVVKNPCEEFPKLTQWIVKMEKDEAVQESFLPPEVHAKFVESFFSGNPDYDMDSHL